MGSDLSTDLAFLILTPASAVRAVEGHAANQNAPPKGRRRSRAEEENPEDLSLGSEGDGAPAHQLDHLA